MHNDEEQPHIHFYVYSDTEVNAKALHYGHKAKKEFHSSIQGVPRRLSRPSRDPLRNGPPRAKKQRLTRAEWKAQKKHAMKVAAAEVRCSIPPRRRRRRLTRASKPYRRRRVASKEKRATREAMQKALALQAEARKKIAQSEALLAQYGLADVPPQPTPPHKGAGGPPTGEFGL